MSEAKQNNSTPESKIDSKEIPQKTSGSTAKAAPSATKRTNKNTGSPVKKTTKKVNTKKTAAAKSTSTASSKANSIKNSTQSSTNSSATKEEVVLTEPAQTIQQTAPAQVAQAPVQKSSGKGFGVFAILFSLAALAGSGFTWYQTQVQQVHSDSSLAVGVSEIGGEVARLGDSMTLLKQQQANNISVDQAEAKINSAEAKLKESLEPLQARQVALSESIQKMSADMQRGANAFVLEEVSQLLKLANYTLNFSGNTQSAIKALGLADLQLKQLSDPRYSAVRTKINEEIVLLKNVQAVDVEGLSVTLSSISGLVPSLPLANEPVSKPVVAEVAKAESVTWRTELQKIWSDIKDVVKIQKIDQPPKPLLVPEQRYFLNQNLQLNLSKAELALMQSNSALYKKNIGSSVIWLNEYFDVNDSAVKKVVSQLGELQSQELDTQLPEISGSFDALQTILGR